MVDNIGKVNIDREKCKGCNLCIDVCSQGCLVVSDTLNKAGYNPVEFLENEQCNACGMCFLICPDICIEVYKHSKSKTLKTAIKYFTR